ncbi:DNA topoisomerase, partial [Sneathia sanguinegens]|uniref:DNA topoisomerase n=1 Tax=Sneathia sanguinegens TaxID=40543 RepID=UPI00288C32CA
KIKGQSVINQGWLKYETNIFENELPNLKIGDKFNVDFKPIEKQTTPPPKINESSLSQYLKNPFKKESDTEDDEYKAMLEGVEIGTEATRTPTIQKCIDMGYIESKKNVFSITDLGKFFIEQLDANKIDLYKNKTVEFSKLQKEIYKGNKKISDILELVKKELNSMIENSNKTENTKYVNNLNPGDVLEIKSAKGTFYKGIFKSDGKEGILPEEMRYFDNRPKINKSIAKKLFEGKDVEFELDYKGKSYKTKLHLVRKGQYLNLEK